MTSHPYVKLIVGKELPNTDADLWFKTANAALPSGLPAESEITLKGEPKLTKFYKTRSNTEWNYVIPLTRNPTLEEVKKLALTWNKAWADGDFEIDYSDAGSSAELYKEIADNGLQEVAIEAAKLCHNSWLSEMTEQGWRYGTQFNQIKKQNPNMLPWDQLSKKSQLNELKRFAKLMEILHNMQLKLVRK